MNHLRKLTAVIAALAFLAATTPAGAFLEDWRQARKVRSFIRTAWGIREAVKLSDDTIRAILDRSYSPGVSYWQLVGLLIHTDEMFDLLQQGRRADAAYVGLKASFNAVFVTSLRVAGLGGVAAIGQAGAAPIVLSLEHFMNEVSKAKFERQLDAYFLLRDAPFNFTHDDILERRSPTVEVQYSDDGWIWDIACDAADSPLCKRNHFRVGGRPLDEGSARDVYELARQYWDAAQQASDYRRDKLTVGDAIRALLEDATCASPGFVPGSSCDSGRPGVCSDGTWHCPGGVVKCAPAERAHREQCNDALDNDCDGQTDEGCAPAPTPLPSASPAATPTPSCVPSECGSAPGGFAYVSNFGSGSLSVVDLGTRQRVATIPVGSYPWGIAFSLDGSRAYVAESSYLPTSPGASVAVIDTALRSVLGRIPVGQSPHGLAVTPDGAKLYVANFFGGSLSVVSTAANTEVAQIDVGDTYTSPREIAVTPDGAKAYATLFAFGGNSVAVIDTQSDVVLRTVTLEGGVGPGPIVMDPVRERAYVCATGLFVIDTQTDLATSLPAVPSCSGLAVNRAGDRLFARGASSVAILDLEAATLLAPIAVRGGSDALALSADERFLYVPSEDDAIVEIVDLAQGAVVGSIATDPGPRIIAVQPAAP